MPSLVTLIPTASSQTGGGAAWTNTAGAIGSNNATPAHCFVSVGGTSEVLSGTSPGGSAVIPVGSTINGIQIAMNVWANNSNGTIASFSAQINSINSTDTSLNGAAISTSVGNQMTIGSSSTFPAGMTGVLASDVNTFIFGLSVSVTGASTGCTVDVTTMLINVYYTPPQNAQLLPRTIIHAANNWLLLTGA